MNKNIVLILCVTFLVFLPGLFNDFVNWDDPTYVLNNQTIQGLSLEHIRTIFSSYVNGNYHPLTMLTFALEHERFGFNPLIFHLINNLFHVLNTWLVFVFISLITKDKFTLFATTLLFGIHPLHVESVTWITERKDVLFTAFYLSSLIAYIKYLKVEQNKDNNFTWSMLSFSLALLSKPSAVSLPLVLILLDFLNQRKINKESILEKIPFFFLSLLFGIVALFGAYNTPPSDYPLAYAYSLTDRIVLSCAALGMYIAKLIAPVGLSAFYPFPEKVRSGLPLGITFYASVNIFICAALVFLQRKNRIFIFGFFFFLATILFNLHLFVVGHVIIADRFVYLPSVGFFLILTYSLSRVHPLFSKKIQNTLITIYTIIALVFCVQTMSRTLAWKNSGTLWSDTIKKNNSIPMAYYNRANHYAQTQQVDLALQDYTRAIELLPNYYTAYNNRGVIHFIKGKPLKAMDDYDKALKINPKHIKAYLNRASVHVFNDDLEKAVENYDAILKIVPNHKIAIKHKNLVIEKLRVKK